MKRSRSLLSALLLLLGCGLLTLHAQFKAKWRCPICAAYYEGSEYERHLHSSHPGNFREQDGNLFVIPFENLADPTARQYAAPVTSKSAEGNPAYAKTLASLAFVRVHVPDIARAYYQVMGTFPPEGAAVQVSVHKHDEPFDTQDLAFPQFADLPFKSSNFALDIRESDDIERTYQGLFVFRNEWAMTLASLEPNAMVRLALWPGRYTITFQINKPQGGSISGIVPNLQLRLGAGEWEIDW